MKRSDFDNIPKEHVRDSSKKRHLSKQTSLETESKKIKKLGPRDIGRIKGWRPSREVYNRDGDNEYTRRRNKYRKRGRDRKKRSSMIDQKELEQLRRKLGILLYHQFICDNKIFD